MHPRGVLGCTWSGFSDPEGTIATFRLYLRQNENGNIIFRSEDLSADRDSFEMEGKCKIIDAIRINSIMICNSLQQEKRAP